MDPKLLGVTQRGRLPTPFPGSRPPTNPNDNQRTSNTQNWCSMDPFGITQEPSCLEQRLPHPLILPSVPPAQPNSLIPTTFKSKYTQFRIGIFSILHAQAVVQFAKRFGLII
jgi:hypothetical protein